MAQDKLATKRKPRRLSINGTRNVLTVSGKEPGFEYRVVNDDGDRVSQFEEMGYEIVKDSNIKVGDRRIANPTKEGSPVQVSVGGGQKAYLMRIPKDWYDEAQADKAKQVDELEKGMLQDTKNSADYGKISVSHE
jgi:hypothetical protein